MSGAQNHGAYEGEEQALGDDDALPWLESDDESDRTGGVDTAQIVGFVAVLAALLLGVFALVYWISNNPSDPDLVADGSLIEAPEGPYKERPANRLGKEFPGTGDVAPAVGEGRSPEARLADGTSEEGAGDPAASDEAASDEAAADARPAQAPPEGEATRSNAQREPSQQPIDGIRVQLAAYTSRSRAEEGWREITRRTNALDGFRYRVIQGKADIGTVFRLQAIANDRSAANTLCASLRSEGIDCLIKP